MYFLGILLVFGYLVIPIVLLVMTSNMRAQVEQFDRTLRAIQDELARLSQALARRSGVPVEEPAPQPQPVTQKEPVVAPEPEPAPASMAAAAPAETVQKVQAEPEPQPEPETVYPEPAEAPRPPRDYADLEKRFGTQWVVWIGGLALALGGIFLVRYTIEQGLFGPGLRVALGALLAAMLVGLGELARRREIRAGLTELPVAHIPSILTAAGTTVAYADVWAAYALYEFLSPGMAFLLLGAVALATLAAALVHGPALAGLGLIGAFVTPALVSTVQPNYWALYLYLAVVTAAAYALARARLWRWLAITAAAFSIFWMFAGISDLRALVPHAFHAAAGFALAAVFVVAGFLYGPAAERGHADKVSSGVLAGYLFGAFMLTMATQHASLALVTLFALCAATVAITWRTEASMLAVPAAALLGVLILAHWVTSYNFETLYAPRGPLSGLPLAIRLEGVGLHTVFGAGLAVLFGGAGFLSQGRSQQPQFSLAWAATGVVTAILVLIALYARITEFERSIPFALIALARAGLSGYPADNLARRDPAPGMAGAAAIDAGGAVAALALALTFALERGWLTVALALMVPGIAFISLHRPLPMLRQVCGLLAGLVLARVLWDPRIVGDAVGTTPILNWILYGYGLPALCFWSGGHLLRRRGDDGPSRSVDCAAILFTALTAMLEIRHLMNDGDIYRASANLGEVGLQVSTWLALAIGLERLRLRSGSIVHDYGARIAGAFALAGIVFGLAMRENPMLTGDPVGGALFNYVLLGYGIPAVLTAILARCVREDRDPRYYIGAAIAAIALALAYLTLEVRTLFHGPVLDARYVSDAEDYTYSAVWLAFGVALLLAGVVLKSQPARYASAAVVILTVAKVFLHDLAGVQGIYRAFSFICLGLVLMGIGWLYQRLLFPPRRTELPPGKMAGPA